MEKRSFDIIGDIAVIQPENKSEEKQLSLKIQRTYPHIKTILKVMRDTGGTYRLRKYKIVFRNNLLIKKSGLRQTETIHREHGCLFKLDVTKVFFNPRDSTIKQHVLKKVKKGERILAMFSGIGSYPIRIAKNVNNCEVVAVEINPAAVKYAEENARLNRVQENIVTLYGNIKKIYKKIGTFNRVIMPLALGGYRFLPEGFFAVNEKEISIFMELERRKTRMIFCSKKLRRYQKNQKGPLLLLRRELSATIPLRLRKCISISRCEPLNQSSRPQRRFFFGRPECRR